PRELTWSAHRGETDPPLGWYSPRFGVRVPTTTLVGTARGTGTLTLTTDLRLPFSTDAPADATDRPVAVGHADPP
ncbi:MAG: heparinase, partial [Ornithinibacter sp.]|nr:heparinase [Ornithinibacter sp.]